MSRPIYLFRCPQCDKVQARLHDCHIVHCEDCGHQFRSPGYYRRMLQPMLVIVGVIGLLAGIWLKILALEAAMAVLVIVLLFSENLPKL